MKYKLIASVLALLLAATALTSCGNKENDGLEKNSEAESETVEVVEKEPKPLDNTDYAALLAFPFEGLVETPASELTYMVDNGQVTVTGYVGASEKIRIPQTVEGCPVTALGDGALAELSQLQVLFIPDSVVTFGKNLLKGCGALYALRTPLSTAEGTAMDGITVQFTNPVSGAVSYVFQADLMIESSKTASPYQIWFVSGTSYPLQLNITVSKGEIYFHHGNKEVVKYNTGVQYGEWMTFRIESYFIDGRVKGKVFINDELAYTVEYYQEGSDVIADMFVDGELYSHAITTNNEKVVSGLSKVEFKALKASVAVCYLDNVSLSGSTKTYE